MVSSVYNWILTHDDSKAFVITYVLLAVVLAIWFGLFWLTVVVGVHFLMEAIKQHNDDPRLLGVLSRSIWELKLDFALIVFGLVVGLYIEVVFAAAGLGAAGRAGAQTAVRFGIWQRVLRGILLSVDDAALIAKEAAGRMGKKDAPAPAAAAAGEGGAVLAVDGAGGDGPSAPDEADGADEGGAASKEPLTGDALWGGWISPRWGLADRISLGASVVFVALLVAAPWLTHHTPTTAWEMILTEMHPFPGD